MDIETYDIPEVFWADNYVFEDPRLIVNQISGYYPTSYTTRYVGSKDAYVVSQRV